TVSGGDEDENRAGSRERTADDRAPGAVIRIALACAPPQPAQGEHSGDHRASYDRSDQQTVAVDLKPMDEAVHPHGPVLAPAGAPIKPSNACRGAGVACRLAS